MWTLIEPFIQHLLTAAGAVVVTKGLASSSDITSVVGALMVLIGFGHTVYTKWKAGQTPPSGTSSSGSVPIKMLSVAFIAASLLTFITGCQSSPQKISYQAAGITAVTVDTAMTLWGTYVAANHPSTNEELMVQSAYEKYQGSMAVLCDAGAAYAATGGTNGTATAALDQAIANSSQELTDLKTLITSFGVTLK